jgi:DNA-binding response OmpR family regulator
MHLRPCFLVVDREHSASISTRKLVIETAKFNVLTAYTGEEAIATLRAFPRVDGVVVDGGMRGMKCADLIVALRSIRKDVVVIAVDPRRDNPCIGADHTLETFAPEPLLELLRSLKPRATDEIAEHDRKLAD